MSTLTVALPLSAPDAALELSYALSHDGRSVTQQGSAPLALLPKADATQLVVPAQKLSFHRITLPQAPKPRLRAALEGLLEEQLLEPPATQALALAPDAQARQTTWVASCDKQWLQAHLQSFEQAGQAVCRIVPQTWPQVDRQLLATGSASDPWLVRADDQGVLCSPLASASLLCTRLPEQEPVWSPPEISQLVEANLSRPVQLQSAAQALMVSQASSWELAQFDIRLAHQSAWLRRLSGAWKNFAQAPQWRPARWGLLALLLAQVLGLATLAWRENRSLSQKKALQTRLFTQTFPQVKVIIDPPAQMQRELALLRASSPAPAPTDLETQLSAWGAAVAGAQAGNAGLVPAPQSLQFSGGTLIFKGLKLSPQTTPQLFERLQAQGFKATLQDEALTLKAQP